MSENSQRQTTLVMTYNCVKDFKPGSYGNGRVIVIEKSPEEFKGKTNQEISTIRKNIAFNSFSLFMNGGIEDAYIYLGDHTTRENFAAFDILFHLAYTLLKKDASKITVVGCDCGLDYKKWLAEKFGCQFLLCGCGGRAKLGEIVKEILSQVPAEPQPKRAVELEFTPEFVFETGGRFNSFTNFTTVADQLFAGCSSGEVFTLESGNWKQTRLKMRQGVNVMLADGPNLLVGDGSCCAGAVKCLAPSGRITKLVPISGQADKRGELKGNVHGIIRYQDQLLAGVGGCAGQHIYRLNDKGNWQYLDNDPEQYVDAMFVDSHGNAYVSMESAIYHYDGEFKLLGHVSGRGTNFAEFNGKVYVASTNFGAILPTNYSRGYIYELTDSSLSTVWDEVGGVESFFTHQNQFYAYGRDFRVNDGNTELLKLENGQWQLLARIDKNRYFFSYQEELYAGGRSGPAEAERPTIFKVSGLN